MLNSKTYYKGWVFNSCVIHYPHWANDTVKGSTSKCNISLSNVVSQITPCLINIRVLTENQQACGTWKPLQDCKILRENKVLLLHCSKEQLLTIRNIYKNLSQLASQIGVCGFLGGHQCRKRWSDKIPEHILVQSHFAVNNMKHSFN